MEQQHRRQAFRDSIFNLAFWYHRLQRFGKKSGAPRSGDLSIERGEASPDEIEPTPASEIV